MSPMLQPEQPNDFFVATGEAHSVQEFVELAVSCVRLDCHDHGVADPTLRRPAEGAVLPGDATKARLALGWSPKMRVPELVKMMVESDLSRYRGAARP
jgi:GDPmannose 4,6-dehydratase